MGANEYKSPLFQDNQKEEFILFMTEMLCMIGAMAAIVIGVDYRETNPNAMLITMSVVLLLIGFIFERGAINSQMPPILRERVWWVGPISFFGLIMLEILIDGSIFTLTIYEIGLFMVMTGSITVGAGLKRVLVRGRFEIAYRGMVARTGESKFQLNRGLLIATLSFIAFIDLIMFLADYEDFPEVIASSVMFIIFVNVCLGFKTEDKSSDWAKASEFD